MTVLEIDQALAATPPLPARREGWRQPAMRGEVATSDRRKADDLHAGRSETAAQAAARMLGAHMPDGVRVGPAIAVDVEYRGRAGRQQLAATGRMYAGQPGDPPFAAMLAVADPLVLLTVSRAGQGAAHWALVPGGPSVTARADALRLLRAMRAEGELLLRAAGQSPLPSFELGADQGWTERDEGEWQLFEDLATLEEWSGRTIPMPSALTGEEVASAAQSALWARTERIDASLTGPLRFTVPPAGDLSAVDELRLQQDFGVTVSGEDLPLGTGDVSVAVEVLEVDVLGDQGLVALTALARREQVVFVLRPPPGRRQPALRTQSPHARPGPAGEPVAEPPAPVVAQATRRLSAALAAIGAEPVATAPSVAALLDELRGDAP